MSFVKIQLKGLKELQAQLLALGAELGVKALAQAARKAFQPVLESARAMAPVDTGELRDSIRLSVVKPGDGDAVVVVGLLIGGGKKLKGIEAIAARFARKYGGQKLPAARRWHFAEFGTAHIAAHPFLRPALDANAGAVLEALKAELVKSIAKALKKKGSG